MIDIPQYFIGKPGVEIKVSTTLRKVMVIKAATTCINKLKAMSKESSRLKLIMSRSKTFGKQH